MLKPKYTGTMHILPFEYLSPFNFERLCLCLISLEGFINVEHLGASGNDLGQDIIARREGKLYVFQCKRVKYFGPSDAVKAIRKISRNYQHNENVIIVLIITSNVTMLTREYIHNEQRDSVECKIWARTEIDFLVKRHPDLLAEFFMIRNQDVFTEKTFDTSGNDYILSAQQVTKHLIHGLRTSSLDLLDKAKVSRNVSVYAREMLSKKDIEDLANILDNNHNLVQDNSRLIQLLYVSHLENPNSDVISSVSRIRSKATDYHVLHHTSLALASWGNHDALIEYISLLDRDRRAESRDTMEYIQYYGTYGATINNTLRKIRLMNSMSAYSSTIKYTIHILSRLMLPDKLATLKQLAKDSQNREIKRLIDNVISKVQEKGGFNTHD